MSIDGTGVRMPSYSFFEQKKQLFDYIVRVMKENRLNVVRFDGLEVEKTIHDPLPIPVQLEDDLKKGNNDSREDEDEINYWTTEA
jgi:hypothetical protein